MASAGVRRRHAVSGRSWNLYKANETTSSDENTYHANSYRVLLTRDRDGLVIFVLDDRPLDGGYYLLISLGIEQL